MALGMTPVGGAPIGMSSTSQVVPANQKLVDTQHQVFLAYSTDAVIRSNGGGDESIAIRLLFSTDAGIEFGPSLDNLPTRPTSWSTDEGPDDAVWIPDLPVKPN